MSFIVAETTVLQTFIPTEHLIIVRIYSRVSYVLTREKTLTMMRCSVSEVTVSGVKEESNNRDFS